MKKLSIIGFFIGCLMMSCMGKTRQMDHIRLINTQGKDGKTSLIKAVESGDIKLVELILSYGASPDIKDHHGKTAFHVAFEAEQKDIFKRLLDHGHPNPEDFCRIPSTKIQHQMQSMIKEKKLIDQMKSLRAHHIPLFDQYFSEFPSGVYYSTAKDLFKKFVEMDFDIIKQSASRSRVKRFIENYSNMGKNAYQITSDTVAIQTSRSEDGEIIGTYLKNDRIYAYQIVDGWIKTDMGWIRKKNTIPVSTTIPIIESYIKESQAILARLNRSISLTTYENSPVLNKGEWIQHNPKSRLVDKAQKELEEILRDPSISKLEEYIIMYQSDSDCQELIKTARETYKQLLLKP